MSRRNTYRLAPMVYVLLLLEVLLWGIGIAAWWVLQRYVPNFRMERPWVLWGLLATSLLAPLVLWDLWRRNKALLRFSEEKLLGHIAPGISSLRTFLRFLLLRLGLGFALVALAGPQLGTRREEVKVKGVDVIVALDVSNSMLTQDLSPSRMEAARRALEQLIGRMKGDRLGIVVFAGQAYTQLPLTADRGAAKLFLNTIGPSMVPTQGTAIGAAIRTAMAGFSPDSPGGKAIVVITDGENHEDDANTAATEAHEAGIAVYTIGMGSPQGAPVPVVRNGRNQGFKKDSEGNVVVSRLNENMLRTIASNGGGAYIRATDQSNGITPLLQDLHGMDKAELGTYRFAGYEDRFQYFLALALVCILFGLLIGEHSPRHGKTGILA